MSEEQEEQPNDQLQDGDDPKKVDDQHMLEGADISAKPAQRKRRPARKTVLVDVADISPRPSYWPIALAFAIVVFLFGAIGNDYIMAVGAVLVVAAIIGWALERREPQRPHSSAER